MTEREVRLTRATAQGADAEALGDALASATEPRTQFRSALRDVGLEVFAGFVRGSAGEATTYHYLEAADLDPAVDRFLEAAAGPIDGYRTALEDAGVGDGLGEPAGEALLRAVVEPDAQRRLADTDVLLASDPVDPGHRDALEAVYDEIAADGAAARAALADLDVLAESAYLAERDGQPWLTLYVESVDWAATQERYAASENELDVAHRETLAEALVEGGFQLEPAFHVVAQPPE